MEEALAEDEVKQAKADFDKLQSRLLTQVQNMPLVD